MSGKILVTGATGKVGSEIVKQMVAQHLEVRAGAHHPDKTKAPAGVEVVHFDYADPASIKAALEGVEGLFFMSPPPQAESSQMAQTVVDLAKQAGVKHIVKLSAAGAESNETMQLRIDEKMVEASGIPYTHLRPSFFNQNFSTGQAQSIKQGAIYLPAGDGKTGFIDTRDIAAVAIAAFTNPAKHANKAYTLTGSEALDHYQVVELISKAAGKEIKYVAMSDEEYRAMANSQSWPQPVIELMSNLYGMVRQGWTAGLSSDVSAVLGREPITFAQYARDYAQVWS